MKISLLPSNLDGIVEAPPSKSCMHRALICAAAADAPTKILCNSFSNDIEATISCLSALGAKFEYGEDSVTVYPIDKTENDETECILDCGESGSTLRFMLPFAASLGKRCTFIGAPRLGERPLAPLCEALNKHNVETIYGEDSFLPCKIRGKLSGGLFEIPGDISSQFITGLLLALGNTDGGEIKATTPLKSAPYIDITTDIQKKFGIAVEKTHCGYTIESGQKYSSPGKTQIEGDYSNGAFWLVAGAIGSTKGICCTNLYEKTFQGDSKIIEILREMGADIRQNTNSVTVYKSVLNAVEIDASDIPDIIPVLCVAASCAQGRTVFSNIERLRAKESDRVETTVNMLRALGCQITADEHTISVEKGSLHAGCVTSANDHRIAMSAAVASLVCDGGVTIDLAEAVAKSYPDFYEKFKTLGGICR